MSFKFLAFKRVFNSTDIDTMKNRIIPFASILFISCSQLETSSRGPSSLESIAGKSCQSAINSLFRINTRKNKIKNYREAAEILYKEYFNHSDSTYKKISENVNSFEKFEFLRILLEKKVPEDHLLVKNFNRVKRIEQVYNFQILLETYQDLITTIPFNSLLKANNENSVHLIWSLSDRGKGELLKHILKSKMANSFNNYSTVALLQAIEADIPVEQLIRELDQYSRIDNPFALKFNQAVLDHDLAVRNLDYRDIKNKEQLEESLSEVGFDGERISKYSEAMPEEFLRDFSPSSIELDKSMRELFGRDLRLEAFDTGSAFSVYKVRNSKGNVVAVFKPSERPFTNFRLETDFFSMRNAFEKDGRQYRDKVFYELNVLFNLNMVPPSSVAESSHYRKGNVIGFLHNYTEGKKATPAQLKSVSKHEAQGMYLLDIITGHQDRHSRNWLIGEEGDVKLIDNDLILHRTKKVRWRKFTKIDKYLPQAKGKIDSDLADKIISIDSKEFSSLLLRNGIPPQAIKYAVIRLEGIQEGIIKGVPLEELVKKYQNLSVINYKSAKYVFYGAAPVIATGAVIHEFTKEE